MMLDDAEECQLSGPIEILVPDSMWGEGCKRADQPLSSGAARLPGF
jgi:hypothetical protein